MVFEKRIETSLHLRAALSVPLSSFQSAVSWPIQTVENIKTTFSSHDKLVKENLGLKSEQLLLKAQVQRFLAIESENNQLKALLSSSVQIQGKVLAAQLLAVDTDPFVQQATIDKGANEHLFVGQPVLDAHGVMGQVIQVGPFVSRILLINDPHSGVPVQVARNGIRAIAVGDTYTGKLRLANIPQTRDIKVGDLVMTSGLGKNYPEGYPVGRVVSVVKDPGLQFATILVEPHAQLDRSRRVLLVWPNRSVPTQVMRPAEINTKK